VSRWALPDWDKWLDIKRFWLERTPFHRHPRIKSRDDEDEKACLHHEVTPGSPNLAVADRETRLATPDPAMTQ
jgi:hypothetical protein